MNLLALLACAALCPAAPAELRALPFDLQQVRLLQGPFQEAMKRDADWLLQIDPDRLLAGFCVEAGLTPKAARYGGWESQGVAGHCLGHHLSACSKMYQATGDPRFRERVAYIVTELAACQKANGNGYLAAIPDGKRIFNEVAQGIIQSKGFDLNGGWVPWYTTHKVMAGLRDAYLYTNDPKALDVLTAMGDWAVEVTRNLTPEQLQTMLLCEQGGMNEIANDLYAITGKEQYLQLAQRFVHHAVIDPLIQQQDQLNGLHANTQIPKLIGAARQYEVTGDTKYRDAAQFFWHTVVENHSYVTGGNSDGEHFGPPRMLAERLSANTTETCNTYNMLKLTKHLFTWEPNPQYADYYERALFNHILASQDPKSGQVTYYVPLKSGLEKEYQSLFDAFTCCVGTGMENHAQYGEAIYFHNENGVYVNLFIASELSWPEKGFSLIQSTQFPESPDTQLVFRCPKPIETTVHLRYPAWAQDGVTIAINGREEPITTKPGGFIPFTRTWNDGDVIAAHIPMRLHLETMPDNPRRAALLFGPIVLAGALGKETVAPDQIPVLVPGDKPMEDWIKPVAGAPLTFTTAGVGRPRDLRLIPFYQMHHQKHIVYWDLFSAPEWETQQAAYRAEKERQQALEKRTIDFVQPGEMQPERDHAFDGANTSCGAHQNRKWRHAVDGGWFAFTLNVLPDQPMELLCTYWGSDSGNRAFDILVDGVCIATQSLDRPKPDAFLDIPYAIPPDLTHGKKQIQVRFQAQPNMIAGGLFGCRILRPLNP